MLNARWSGLPGATAGIRPTGRVRRRNNAVRWGVGGLLLWVLAGALTLAAAGLAEDPTGETVQGDVETAIEEALTFTSGEVRVVDRSNPDLPVLVEPEVSAFILASGGTRFTSAVTVVTTAVSIGTPRTTCPPCDTWSAA